VTQFGHYTLFLGWLLALVGTVGGAYAGYRRSTPWFLTVRNASMGTFLCLFLSIVSLGACFLGDDYTNQYVWQYSNRDMAPIYKFTAIWGGMDGSMLLWCSIVAASVALLAWHSLSLPRQLLSWTLAFANSSTLFFSTITLFVTNPFRFLQAPFIPPDGNGLNPLLQNPYMAIHPPMLYLGFTTFAIPYAFCMGALFSRTLSNEWIRYTRRWTLVSWSFLTIGIVLGGHWAYLELGWGGFWAWDPVENASFLPWLTGTAFLHSVMVQERKNILKLWNVWLIVLTYALTVFGTFLTRSGIVQSVHAFASTDVGWVFLLYLGIIFVVAIYASYTRRQDIGPSKAIESILSREAAFLVNNLLFLSICFAVLWGIMFPVLSEAFLGQKQAVGVPFFNTVTLPMFLVLVFLMGFGPLVAWRKASWESIRRTFLKPFLSGLFVACLLVWAGVSSFLPILSYSLCWFVTMTILGELYRVAKVQRTSSDNALHGTAQVLRRHKNRYGGYIVHFGVVVVTIGITASMAHKVEREFSLAPGQTYEVGRFVLSLDQMKEENLSNYDALVANVTLKKRHSGEVLQTLKPEVRVYRKNNETTHEVALRMSPREDVYLVLAGVDESGTKAALKLFINPLQIWLWFGAMIMIVGTVIILLPHRFGGIRGVSEPIGERA
jgi:cytochrome c-type biogenesis protein CcmF